MSKLKQGKLEKPSVDPLEALIAEIKKVPENERATKGRALLGEIIAAVMKAPHRSTMIEDAALAWGLPIGKAADLRGEVERAALDQREQLKPASNVVRVNLEVAEQQRARLRASADEWDPPSSSFDEETPLRWWPPGYRR
jgi:hypothetical protein